MFKIYSISDLENYNFKDEYRNNIDQLNNSPYTLLSIFSQSEFYKNNLDMKTILYENNRPYDIITKTGILSNGIYSNYSFYSYVSVMTHCLLFQLNLDNVYCELENKTEDQKGIYNGYKYYKEYHKNKKIKKEGIILTTETKENSIIFMRYPLTTSQIEFIKKNNAKICYQTEYNYDPTIIWILNYSISHEIKLITNINFSNIISECIKQNLIKLTGNANIQNAIESSILLAKKVNIKLLPWINNNIDNFCDEIIKKRFIQMDEVNIKKLKNNKLENSGMYKDIKFDRKEIDKMEYILENTYQYTERTHNKKFMDVELYINSIQKLLNYTLNKNYKININNKIVTRAWIKMFEILCNFEIVKDKNNVFFTCEAPGNFIAALLKYCEIKKIRIEWNAQSLKTGLQDDYDMIKKNKNRWDIHNDIGDITNMNTFKYYLEKYVGVDVYISDCGAEWTSKTTDLGPYQIVYSLLLPKVGGNSVIKTFMSNTATYYISLIYLLTCFYENVYIFKSNNNMWSNEIYFVLLNKKNIPNEIIQNLLKSLENFNMSKDIYLIPEIPKDFVYDLVENETELMKVFIDLKEIMLLFSLKEKYFEKYKDILKNAILRRNYNWTKKYIDK